MIYFLPVTVGVALGRCRRLFVTLWGAQANELAGDIARDLQPVRSLQRIPQHENACKGHARQNVGCADSQKL